METKFFTDAVFRGRTSNAVSLGTILTLGRFWVRRERCHAVYRGQDGEMDYDSIQAVMDLGDSDVTVPAQALPPDTIWEYARRQVSDCGLESTDSDAVIIRIDSAGDMVPLTPNVPLSLQVEKVAGGKLKLRWRYDRIGEQVSPTGFRIYIDSGDGFNFASPDDTVAYNLGGNNEFDWTSDALTDGQLYRFCLRSYAEGGGESQNTNYVAAVADATGPAAPTGLTVSWE